MHINAVFYHITLTTISLNLNTNNSHLINNLHKSLKKILIEVDSFPLKAKHF